jgi:hypothetical protein
VLNDTIGRLWPNGEFSIWRQKEFNPLPPVKPVRPSGDSLIECLVRSRGVLGALEALCALGLSKVSISDKPNTSTVEPRRHGLKGLTSPGARKVRNACFLIERDAPRKSVTFATVTLPDSLSDEQLKRAHVGWGTIVEHYTRELRRVLVACGLSGKVVGVSEVQPKRYESTGIPFLHAHFVFQGRARGKSWQLTPSKHDEIWERALKNVVGDFAGGVASACQLEVVRKSASQYLSKYMSKGGEMIDEIASGYFADWLPKRWYHLSRKLLNSIKKEIKQSTEIAQTLTALRYAEPTLFKFWKDIFLPVDDKEEYGIWIAACGKILLQI